MRRSWVIVFSLCLSLLVSPTGDASQEYTGRLVKRPEGDIGTWVIGKRRFDVTENTKIEEEYGPIEVGVCIVVEYAGKRVSAVKSEEDDKCPK